VKKIITQKILIYGIVIMLIISFWPIITSGIAYNDLDKQTEKTFKKGYDEDMTTLRMLLSADL